MRPSGRELNEMRPVSIETNVTKHAEGSCMIRMGDSEPKKRSAWNTSPHLACQIATLVPSSPPRPSGAAGAQG